MIKLCIANRKGGVSKTTTAVNMSSILVEKGYKVLLIDLDPQGNATENLGLNPEELSNTIYQVLAKDLPLYEAIHETKFGIDIIPANTELAYAEIALANKLSRDKILSNAIGSADLAYDFVILDLPPNLGLVSINGLVASDRVIITVDVGVFSLTGISDLMALIGLIKNQLNPKLDVLGVLMTRVDNRTNLAKNIKKILETSLGSMVFNTQIRQNVAIAESQINNKPINFYDKACAGYIEYCKFAEEVLESVKQESC